MLLASKEKNSSAVGSISPFSNLTLLNILEFLNANEKDLFIYNLDKKLFCFEIFSSLNK